MSEFICVAAACAVMAIISVIHGLYGLTLANIGLILWAVSHTLKR